ncbi:hypothetical protein [Bacillus licheniformis]|uniref:hypothetical protein n=1 Tax=Bacillus licheniformis TaxID=1402 RepID=UPI000BA6B71A|nr:hypothetical protein [Bacillus licheniformis]MDE1418987.1 hypothetical protein [Bacillus licheniformis]PAE47334.1 hypothetical protein CHH95_20445 [Bacillus licheniformis]PDH70416.1 hypothetical protein TY90_20770 [Bacillus licheniformis]HZG73963.1 hypothetical protein [Chondromyces sp.]
MGPEEKKEILQMSLFIAVIVGTVIGLLYYFAADIKYFFERNKLAAAICLGVIYFVGFFAFCLSIFKR